MKILLGVVFGLRLVHDIAKIFKMKMVLIHYIPSSPL